MQTFSNEVASFGDALVGTFDAAARSAMQPKVLVVIALLLSLGGVARAQFDIPQRQGLVNDFAAQFNAETTQAMDLRLRDFLTRHQVELAVVTIPLDHLQGHPIEQYALQMANTWGVGSGRGQGGLVLVVAIDPPDPQGVYHGATRLEVSRRLEAAIPHDIATQIMRQLRDDLRAGRVAEAIQRAIDGTERVLEQRRDPSALPVAPSAAAASGGSVQGAKFLLAMSLICGVPVAFLLAGLVKRRRSAPQPSSHRARISKPKRHRPAQSNKPKRRGTSRVSRPKRRSSSPSDGSSASWDLGNSSADVSSGGDFGGGGGRDSW